MKIYIVSANIAEGSVSMVDVEESELWSNENPDGLTYQDMTGPHGYILYDGNDYEEANRIYNEYIEEYESM